MKFLGSGAFGEVFEGKARELAPNGAETKVAVKVSVFYNATDSIRSVNLYYVKLYCRHYVKEHPNRKKPNFYKKHN